VSLSYRPKEIAESPDLYREMQWQMLEDLLGTCKHYTEYIGDPWREKQYLDGVKPSEISEALDAITKLRMATLLWRNSFTDLRPPEDRKQILSEEERDRLWDFVS
jgi:hypothetical protein